MAEISKSYQISYRWWANENDVTTIPPEHREILDEMAENRIAEMLKEGYTSGELHDCIHNHNTAYDTEYRGWWEKKPTVTEHVSFPS